MGAYRRGKSVVSEGSFPTMHGTRLGGTVVKHTEMVCSIAAHPGWKLGTEVDFNPGLPAFKWLSNIAKCFEMYNVNGCVWTYVPHMQTVQPSANPGNVGTVYMANSLNLYCKDPGSAADMTTKQHCVRGPPYQGLTMAVEEDKRKGGQQTSWLLVRNGEPPVGATKQLYDDHKFWIYTDNTANTEPAPEISLGDVYVTYSVTFINPTVVNTAGTFIATFNAANTDASHPLGTTVDDMEVAVNDLGIRWTSATELTMPMICSGDFRLDYQVVSPGTHSSNVTSVVASNSSSAELGINAFVDNTSPSFQAGPGTSVDHYSYYFNVPAVHEDTLLTFSVASMTGETEVFLSIESCNGVNDWITEAT